MADVVGTAFVKIKALTDGLAKDIEKSFKKGVKDSDLDRASEDAGKESGEAFGDGFAKASGKRIKKKSKTALPVDVLAKDLKKSFRDIQESFEQLEFNFDSVDKDVFLRRVGLDDDSVSAALSRIREVQRETGVALRSSNLSLPFDEGRFRNFFRRFRGGVTASNRASQNWLGRLRTSVRKTADLIDFDLNGALRDALSKFRELGRVGIGRLGRTVFLLGGAIAAALPFIQDIGATIIAYATGLVAQIGFLVTALGGLGVAAGTAVGSAAFAFLPLILAFKAETPALERFNDSMKAAGEEFERIGIATQKTLLPALDNAVFVLGDLVPLFSEYGEIVGEIVGSHAEFAANTLVGERALGRFEVILEGSLNILEDFLTTIIHIGDILSGIFVAALPAAERFAESIRDLVSRWAELINMGLDSGNLTRTFDLWYDRAELLGSALGNLIGALFDILQVGADSSDNVFIRFDEWAERYRAFTESEAGQNKLKLIFDNALAVMREVNGVLAELFGGLGRLEEVDGVDGLVSALQTFREAIPGLKEDWAELYDIIKEAVKFLASRALRVFRELQEPLDELGESVADLLDTMADTNSLVVFIELMRIFTETLNTLLNLPGLGQFLAYMLAVASAFKIGAIVLGPFLTLFSGAIPIISGAASGFAGLAGAFGTIASGFGLGAFAAAIAGVVAAVAAIAATVAIVVVVFKNWDTIVAALNRTWDTFWEAVLAVGRFIRDPMERITALRDILGGLASTVGGILLRALSTAGSALAGLGSTIASGLVGAIKGLPKLLGDAALSIIRVLTTVLVGGFLALPALLYTLVTKVGPVLVEGFSDAFGLLVEFIPTALGAIVGFFVNLPGRIIEALGSIGGALADFISGVPEQLGNVLGTLGPIIGDSLATASEAVLDFLAGVPGALADFAKGLPELIGTALSAVGGAISDGFEDALELFGEFPEEAVSVISELPGLLVEGIKKLPGLLGDALSAAARFAFEALRATIHRAIQAVLILFVGIPVLVVRALSSLQQTLARAFKDAFRFLVNEFPNIVAGIIDFFLGLPGDIVGALDGTGSAIATFFTETAWPVVSEAVLTALDETIQFFKDLPENLVSALSSLARTLNDVFFTAMDGAKSLVSGIVDDIIQFFTDLPGDILTATVSLGETLLGIGTTMMEKLLEGLGAAPGKIVELSTGLLNAVRDLGKSLINGVIDALNDLLPNEIGEVTVAGVTILEGINLPNDPIPRLSTGGFVGTSGFFNSGPVGTDTIPALLTPGEFVLRRSVAQSIPPSVLHSLNRGDSRIVGLLSSLSQTRPGGVGSLTGATQTQAVGGRMFGPGSVVIYAQGTSATEVASEFDRRVNWKLTSRGDK